MKTNAEVGKTIDGRYLIVESLGLGGFSVVYKAEQLFLNRLVALKMLKDYPSRDHQDVQRFLREGQALASLSHPHIASVFAFGISDSYPYLVCEFLEGESLEQRTASNPLSLKDALPVFIQIADAMAYAHSSGILHRDLKPCNVMLTTTPSGETIAKVIDFGLAGYLGSYAKDHRALTEPNTVLGTPGFISPEYFMGQPATPQSDIYSFGMLMMRTVSNGFIVPEAIERVIATATEADVARRYSTMEQVKEQLEDLLCGKKIANQQPFRINALCCQFCAPTANASRFGNRVTTFGLTAG